MDEKSQRGSVKIRRTRKQWQTIISDFNASGLSPSSYCEKNGIAYTSFAKWRSLLKASNRAGPKHNKSTKEESISFIEIPRQTKPSSTTSHWDVELELGAGVVLRLRSI